VVREFPCSDRASTTVHEARESIHSILHGEDDRLLVVIGPCSIHDPKAALEYANRLNVLRQKHWADLEVVMRVYFEKPRTTVGWKGLINDPDLDGSFQINKGLRIARELLLDINEIGLPAGSEFLDMITPQYWRPHDREPNPSGAGIRFVMPGWFQEWHRWQYQHRY
jgi:3-deoxy-7-phosphoheptulonate synthase